MIKDVGYQSYDFWKSFMKPDKCLLPLKQDPFKASPLHCSFKTMQGDLSTTNPLALADCWIHKESVLPDLRRCLKRFQRLHKQRVDIIDWRMLEKVENGNATVAVNRGHSQSAAKEDQCKEVFQDSEMEDLMKRVDPYLFNAFGYRRCCEPSESRTEQGE